MINHMSDTGFIQNTYRSVMKKKIEKNITGTFFFIKLLNREGVIISIENIMLNFF